MLNLTRQNFNKRSLLLRNKLKGLLLKQQKKLQEDLKSVKDPVLDDGLPESSEPGTDSWLADVHNQAVAVKENLQSMLSSVSKSLINLRKGTYGKCEKCGKNIEEARLEAMPTATLCLACSRKPSKK